MKLYSILIKWCCFSEQKITYTIFQVYYFPKKYFLENWKSNFFRTIWFIVKVMTKNKAIIIKNEEWSSSGLLDLFYLFNYKSLKFEKISWNYLTISWDLLEGNNSCIIRARKAETRTIYFPNTISFDKLLILQKKNKTNN